MDMDVATVAVIQERVAVGGSYSYKGRLGAYLGLESLGIGSGKLKAMFSYSLPVGNKITAHVGSYELILNYNLRAKKKKRKNYRGYF